VKGTKHPSAEFPTLAKSTYGVYLTPRLLSNAHSDPFVRYLTAVDEATDLLPYWREALRVGSMLLGGSRLFRKLTAFRSGSPSGYIFGAGCFCRELELACF